MCGTTIGKDIFDEVSNRLTEMNLSQDKLVALTDGIPATFGRKSGLEGRIHERMSEANATNELTVHHYIIH